MALLHSPALFFSVQFPFADVRSFLPEPHRLPIPNLLSARATDEQFIRQVGSVRDRRNTDVNEWAGEDVFVGAPQALKFQSELGKLRLGKPLIALKPICTFRRFFSDGVVGRLEVGLQLSGRPNQLYNLDPEQSRALLHDCANLPVWIRNSEGRLQEHKLLDAGGPLAEHLLRATTERFRHKLLPWTAKKASPTQPWWLTAGKALLLLEHRPMECLELPPKSKVVELVSDQDFRLAHLALPHRGAFIGTWFLGASPRTEIDQLRRLRIHLFRLHSEREGLRLVLQHYEKLGFDPSSLSSSRLSEYLEDANGLFQRGQRYGLDQAILLDTAKYSTDTVDSGGVTTTLARLKEVLTDIRGRIRLTDDPPIAFPPINRGAIFISYTREDKRSALLLQKALEQAGLNTWMDQKDLRPGHQWETVIRNAIQGCSAFVPLLSHHVLTPRRHYFRVEWEHAEKVAAQELRTALFIVPVALDEISPDSPELPDGFRKANWVRLQGGEVPPELLETLKQLQQTYLETYPEKLSA